jgi:DNA-binding NarL/FixJ family response regulator
MKRVDRRHSKPGRARAHDHLDRARLCYERKAWADAFRVLSIADQASPLQAEDLERLAMSAYLIGRDDEYMKILERAYHAHLEGERLKAVRCAFWLGFQLFLRGEAGRATGWLARAHRLLDAEERECAERGYLLLPVVEQRLDAGDFETAYAQATNASQIGERCRDPDLVASSRHQLGRIRIRQGQVEQGLALLDEVMVAVVAGELSSLVTGLMYCSVIQACREIYAFGRACEWTDAMARWCGSQPDMVAFTGACRVHRAEILQLRGAWTAAIEEAQHARERSHGSDQQAEAAAFYQQAEVHRLRGECRAAEEAYQSASRLGLDPQPGLALLRLTQGRVETAAAAIRRTMGATTDRLSRTRLLPAYVEIMLAVNDIHRARSACCELEEIAGSFDTGMLRAMAAHARGAVELAAGDAQAAVASLRQAFDAWQRIEAPYVAARVRLLIGAACRALGDEDGARLELEAAQSTFERLGAAPDTTHITALTRSASSGDARPLSPRELQVLRLVAAGKTNKAIAAQLALSEKTVDRHVSNIFTKLDVPSRTAATAYAYENKLL